MSRPEITYDHELMLSMRLFTNAAMESIEGYFETCSERWLNPGEMLLSPEKENNHLYLIVTGRLRVHLESPVAPPLVTLGPGECAGEMSIVDHKMPSAWVLAAERTHLLVIGHVALLSMINSSHEVAKNLLFILSCRLREGNDMILSSIEISRQFEHFATVDSLTGLHNRRWLDEMFDREITRCQTDNRPLCLAMLDIDNFKVFNDRFGHLAGDRALQTIAKILRQSLRPTDMIARYGGEEFAILFPETEIDSAVAIAERLRAALVARCDEICFKKDTPPVTASLGVAQMRRDDTLKMLISSADEALYRAKSAGKNHVAR